MDRIEGLGRPAATAPRVHPLVQRKALVTIPGASRQLGLSQPTVTSALDRLTKLNMVHEMTGRRRGKVFVYTTFLNLLSEGTEPLPPRGSAPHISVCIMGWIAAILD